MLDLLAEYKDLYYKELEHSDRLNGKISTALTLLTVLGTGEILLWKENFPFIYSTKHLIFIILSAISFVLFLITLTKFIKAYSNYNYNYFPIEDMHKNIQITLNKTQNIENGEQIATEHILKMHKERFISDAIHNQKQNIDKNTKHRTLTISIFRTFLIIVLAFAFWIVFINQDEAVHQVNITIGGEIMIDDKAKEIQLPETPPPITLNETFSSTEMIINSDSKEKE